MLLTILNNVFNNIIKENPAPIAYTKPSCVPKLKPYWSAISEAWQQNKTSAQCSLFYS